MKINKIIENGDSFYDVTKVYVDHGIKTFDELRLDEYKNWLNDVNKSLKISLPIELFGDSVLNSLVRKSVHVSNFHGDEDILTLLGKQIDYIKSIKKIDNDNLKEGKIKMGTSKFTVTLKDRKIRINHYLLSNPHATGKNMYFFEHVFSHPKTLIKIKDVPELVKKEINGKSMMKMVNALGFKGEVLKAFFPKRGKTSICFEKEVLAKDLENRGVKVVIFIQELQLAHDKNSLK